MNFVLDIADQLTAPGFMPAVLTFLAVIATIIACLPRTSHVARLEERIKNLTTNEEKLRAQARETQLREKEKAKAGSLRQQANGTLQWLVDKFGLADLMTTEHTKSRLERAGFRGQRPLVVFIIARLFSAIGLTLLAILYAQNLSTFYAFATVVGGFAAGFYLPSMWVENLTARRRQEIELHFPDSLDLLVICCNAGMSIEAAFHKVANEIGAQCVPLAEEMLLTTAELSYLPDRATAFGNFASRTGLQGISALATTLTQTERYGTPVSQALRVLSEENRVARLQRAERKAAALPATLAVPVVLFFLPVLFIAILGPAALRFLGF